MKMERIDEKLLLSRKIELLNQEEKAKTFLEQIENVSKFEILDNFITFKKMNYIKNKDEKSLNNDVIIENNFYIEIDKELNKNICDFLINHFKNKLKEIEDERLSLNEKIEIALENEKNPYKPLKLRIKDGISNIDYKIENNAFINLDKNGSLNSNKSNLSNFDKFLQTN